MRMAVDFYAGPQHPCKTSKAASNRVNASRARLVPFKAVEEP